ncbi:hypothetical protein O7602_13460 [Micromonospora sp. WMMD1128]|uniref:hypothetical protein n=1 Tax=unclassified Micromonospora TaxID=2617518 RepID=UPI00248ACE6B|nr:MULTISPECIES: hypothetical protein [unclassified Micromonospora]WBB76472.1 hypothetical protein O7602_13460 [Micromonospora sp. WMMD1128]WFE35744.1 hypothetical protein O7613_10305 [Micromonospora sp. WMMD975]
MVKPQQEELRRSDLGATSQDSRKAAAGGGDRSRGAGTSRGDAGRPVPKGQVSPYGPAGEPVAEDDSDR